MLKRPDGNYITHFWDYVLDCTIYTYKYKHKTTELIMLPSGYITRKGMSQLWNVYSNTLRRPIKTFETYQSAVKFLRESTKLNYYEN